MSSSYFGYERPSWFRSYPVMPGGPTADFLQYSPPERKTWLDLVRRFDKEGLIETKRQAGPSNPILHFTALDGSHSSKRVVITDIGGHKLVQPVEAGKIGTTAAVPYLHAEHLLFALYQAKGGTLPRSSISASRMASAYDLIV